MSITLSIGSLTPKEDHLVKERPLAAAMTGCRYQAAFLTVLLLVATGMSLVLQACADAQARLLPLEDKPKEIDV